MFCVSCGNQLPDDAAFCNSCGVKTVQPSSTNLPVMPNPRYVTIELTETMRERMNSVYPPAQTMYPVSQPLPQNLPVSSPTNPLYPGNYGGMPSPTSHTLPTLPTSLILPAPPATPTPVLPLTAFQRFLVRVFQPSLASNGWLGVMAGGLVALVGSAICTGLFLTIAQSLYPGKSQLVFNDLGIWNFQNSFRNSLQLLMIALGAASHFQYNAGSTLYSFSISSQLDGLLLIPALFLIIGGYIAGSTDFQNRIRVTLGRGAAIAIPFAVLLLIAVSQVNGAVPEANGVIDANSTMVSIDIPTLLIFGLLWGCVFGVLGASIKLAYGQWRLMMRTFVQTSRYAQLAGMSIGGIFATFLGIACSLLLIWGVTAFTSFSIPLFNSTLCISTGWQDLTLWSLAQGPLHAVNLFAFSYGSPVVISNPSTNTCFYTHLPHATLSILDPSVQHFKWLYLLLILPAVSLFCGGRVSVAASRVRGLGAATLQGALIAIPFTLLMMALCLISSITYTQTSTTAQSYIETAGVDLFTMLLWSLLSGGVMGALGGLYQASALSNGVHHVLAALAFPLLLIGKPVIFVLNGITGQSRVSTASAARLLFYAALISAVLLAVACGITGSELINMNQIISFQENQRTLNILDALTITIPGLFLLLAVAVALTSDPSVAVQSAPVPSRLESAPNYPYSTQGGI